MNKFICRPIEVEAVQFYAERTTNKAFQDKQSMFMKWPVRYDSKGNPSIVIQTDGGDLRCRQGDWIIKGITGEYSICRADAFERSFKKVGE